MGSKKIIFKIELRNIAAAGWFQVSVEKLKK